MDFFDWRSVFPVLHFTVHFTPTPATPTVTAADLGFHRESLPCFHSRVSVTVSCFFNQLGCVFHRSLFADRRRDTSCQRTFSTKHLLVLSMFRNTFQSGFLSILYSIGSNPLQIWDKKVKNGAIKRVTDQDIQSMVIEVTGSNVVTTFITCPVDPRLSLGIKLPILVIIVKNLKKFFSFEIEILDDKNVKRRFRSSNFQTVTRVRDFICTMPLRLDEGWNQISFNLSDFTKRAYGTNYVETVRVSINANCRLRRIYFADRIYSEDELPPEFKLYLPITSASSSSVMSNRWSANRK